MFSAKLPLFSQKPSNEGNLKKLFWHALRQHSLSPRHVNCPSSSLLLLLLLHIVKKYGSCLSIFVRKKPCFNLHFLFGCMGLWTCWWKDSGSIFLHFDAVFSMSAFLCTSLWAGQLTEFEARILVLFLIAAPHCFRCFKTIGVHVFKFQYGSKRIKNNCIVVSTTR